MTTAKRRQVLGASGLAVLVLGFACTGSSEPDLSLEPASGGTGSGTGGRAPNGGSGGGIEVMVPDEQGGACPTVSLEPPDYGGASGEGGSAGEPCDGTEMTYFTTPNVDYAVCGCSLGWYDRNVVCYPAAPSGGSCDEAYPRATR